jgi:hypothetical protein
MADKPPQPMVHPLVAALGCGLDNTDVVAAVNDAKAGYKPAETQSEVIDVAIRLLQTDTGADVKVESEPELRRVRRRGADKTENPADDAAIEDIYGQLEPGLVKDFGAAASSAALQLFTGYLGGKWRHENHEDWWRILFVDSVMRNWIMVKSDDILYSQRVDDDKAAFGSRDYLWVAADAHVGRGGAAASPESLFVSGTFTRAGDFSASLRGDTWSGSNDGGLLDEATTPSCCGSNSHH